MVDKIILGLLHYRDLTIYEMLKAIKERISLFYSASAGSVHPSLKKLEKTGAVGFSEKVENGRRKKIYRLTDKGKGLFHEWLSGAMVTSRIKEDGVLKIFFMSFLDQEERLGVLKSYRQDVIKSLTELRDIEEDSVKQIKTLPKSFLIHAEYQLTALDYGLEYYQFLENWISRLINKLGDGS